MSAGGVDKGRFVLIPEDGKEEDEEEEEKEEEVTLQCEKGKETRAQKRFYFRFWTRCSVKVNLNTFKAASG